jgi:hypothetical protein
MGKELWQGFGRLTEIEGKFPDLAETRSHLGPGRRAELCLAVDPADRVDFDPDSLATLVGGAEYGRAPPGEGVEHDVAWAGVLGYDAVGEVRREHGVVGSDALPTARGAVVGARGHGLVLPHERVRELLEDLSAQVERDSRRCVGVDDRRHGILEPRRHQLIEQSTNYRDLRIQADIG